jgi:hypothetical protein
VIFPYLDAVAQLGALGGDDYRRAGMVPDGQGGSIWQEGGQVAAPQPEGYARAAHLASGGGKGGTAYNAGRDYYYTPEAKATREEGRNLLQQFGMPAPDYMTEVPRTAASPITNALVNGATANPLRDQMEWQYRNPTAQRAGDTTIYHGDSGDYGSKAEEALAKQSAFGRDIARYDATQAENRSRQVASQGEADRGKAALMQAETERKVIDQSQNPPTPAPDVGKAALDVIQDAALKNGYLTDVVAKLNAMGAFQGPHADAVKTALRIHFGTKMDELMAGGREGLLAQIPSPFAGAPGFGNHAYSQQHEQTRQTLAGAYPDVWAAVPNARSPSAPAPAAPSPGGPGPFAMFGVQGNPLLDALGSIWSNLVPPRPSPPRPLSPASAVRREAFGNY